MSPTIRIDDEVYRWLQSQAVPFEDNPNSVLRRLAGLDIRSPEAGPEIIIDGLQRVVRNKTINRRPQLTTGKELIWQWSLPVIQARFHREGRWYEHLTKFPAAYCDRYGYVVFMTKDEVQKSPSIHAGKQVEVRGGLSSVAGYVKVNNPIEDPDSLDNIPL